MINLNFSVKIDLLATAESRAALIGGLLAFQNEAKAAGLNSPSLPRSSGSSASTVDHGPLEKQWLVQSGKSRMKVPSTWEGTREGYAFAKLHGGMPLDAVSDDNEEHESETLEEIYDGLT
jgi:hypothetical protein